MAFKNVKEFVSKKTRSGKPLADIAISCSAQEKNLNQVRYSISSKVLKELRWVNGDRIEVMFDDESKMAMLRRAPSDSVMDTYKLVVSEKGEGRGVISTVTPPGTPYHYLTDSMYSSPAENVTLDGSCILFDLPGTPYQPAPAAPGTVSKIG